MAKVEDVAQAVLDVMKLPGEWERIRTLPDPIHGDIVVDRLDASTPEGVISERIRTVTDFRGVTAKELVAYYNNPSVRRDWETVRPAATATLSPYRPPVRRALRHALAVAVAVASIHG